MYAKCGAIVDAMRVFNGMGVFKSQQESVSKCGELLHAHVIILGHESNNFVTSSLIDNYSKCGKIDKASILFENSTIKDPVLLNMTSMMTAYAQSGKALDCLKIFDRLVKEKDFIPDHVYFTVVLTACNHVGPAAPNIDLGLEEKTVRWRLYGSNSMVEVKKNVICLAFIDGGAEPRTSIVLTNLEMGV